MIIEGEFEIDASRENLYQYIINPELMAACLPGCESIELAGQGSYRARVTVALGAIKARFNLMVEITKETPPLSVLSVTRGEEGGRASSVTATNEVFLDDLGNGKTRVRYSSDVSVTGRLGKFALGVMKKKAQSMGEEFAANLGAKLHEMSGLAAQSPAPVAAGEISSWWRKLIDNVRRWLKKL